VELQGRGGAVVAAQLLALPTRRKPEARRRRRNAKAMVARKKAYQDAHPETKRGGDRKFEAAKKQSSKSGHRSKDEPATS